jgi:hypothetical protein
MDLIIELEKLIREHVNKMSYRWFQKKEAVFKKHLNYVSEREAIVFEDEYPDGISLPEKIILLTDYCASYLPLDKELTNYGSFKHIDHEGKFDKYDCTRGFAEKLTNELASFISSSTTSEKKIFILKCLELIKTIIKDNSEAHKNNRYRMVLWDFFDHCRFDFNIKFMKELSGHEFISRDFEPQTNTLIFDLDKPTYLASLIYILINANLTLREQEDVLEFCYQHFRYYDRRSGLIKHSPNLKTFRESFNRIERGEDKVGLRRIKEKLLTLLDTIQ